MQIGKFVPFFIHHQTLHRNIYHSINPGRQYFHTTTHLNMGRYGRGRGRGGGGGRGGYGRNSEGREQGRGRGGYDWRKHVRSSADPVVQTEVRTEIQIFIDSNSTKKEIRCYDSETKNTYKQYCKQMGVGWARGSSKGTFKMIRFTGCDPATTLWKKVWCFYFNHYCGVDLIASATVEGKNSEDDRKPSALSSSESIGISAWDIDEDSVKSAWDDDEDSADDTDIEEAAAISRLQQIANNDIMDSRENSSDIGEESERSDNKLILDTTADSFDGKRCWTKVRDLLQAVKANGGELWEECCSLGVNNCSERKLEQHIDQVNKFFDLQGKGPSQKIRGKKLRVAVGDDESVHFLDSGDTIIIEYAKAVKFCDTSAIKDLIQLVDKANHSVGAHTSLKSADAKDNLPSNSFNNNWRKGRSSFIIENTDSVYHERKNTLRKRLPAFGRGEDFCNRVFENDVVVLCGATG